MSTYEVEWSYSARGVVTVVADGPAEAKDIVGEMETDKLMDSADRVNWETYPVQVEE